MKKPKKESLTNNSQEASKACREIAVIAAACRFPDADTPEAFWDNIVNGRCSFKEVPSDRWSIEQHYSPEPVFGKTGCRTGAFIEDVYGFEPEMFNIDDREAAIMDPQQRIMLELFHELVERAGYSKGEMEKKLVGLYLSPGVNQFYEFHLNTLQMEKFQEFNSFSALSDKQQTEIMEEWKNRFGKTEPHPNILVDNIPNMVASRISQEFNLKGPSIVVDTACSSALVTIHLACEAIQRGECDMAVAGGINLLLTPTPYLYFSYAGALSNRGECRVFDAGADGFVPGEGAGMVMLKAFDKAVADGDRILGVIKASMINNDGRSIGVMAPNPDGQREVIEALYKKYGMNPCDIQYVEAHGTGTAIGDPSEIRALAKAFGTWGPQKQSIAIGSVKANIGHLLNAAGIASFIKVLMALNYGIKPPVVNVNTPNPLIKFEQTPFNMLREAREWKKPRGKKRTAAINSFGFGGTNCHMVLEEPPETANHSLPETLPAADGILCISSHSEESLYAKIQNLAADMEVHPEYRLEDICFTLSNRENYGKYRYSTAASSCEELLGRLKNAACTGFLEKRQIRTAFMFTGQGSQYVGMGKELYECLPGFRDILDQCSDAFKPHLDNSITDLIFGIKADEPVLSQTGITQPVVFSMDYAIGKYLMSLGIQPAYMMGHSLGEWVAACLAGCVSLRDAAGLVALRGRLMQELKAEGSMAAVFAPAGKVEELIAPFRDRLWIGAYNATHQVVSGYSHTLEEFAGLLQKNGIVCKKLKVSQAFHTPLMNPMLEIFEEALNKVEFCRPVIPIISNVTGDVMTEVPGAVYWTKHILSAVKFEQSVKRAGEMGVNSFVEVGPDKILSGMARGAVDRKDILILETQDRKKKGLNVLLNTLGSMYGNGLNLDLKKLDYNSKPRVLPLSTYPFKHRAFKPDFGSSGSTAVFKKLFHQWAWDREERIEEQIDRNGSLIILHDGNLKDILSEWQNLNYSKIFQVVSGREYNFDGDGFFTVNPGNSAHFKKVLENIPEQQVNVLHLWNCQQECCNPQEILANDTLLEQGAFSLIHLGKALAERAGKSRVMVVTNRMSPVMEGDTSQNPHQFMAAALGLAADQENNGIELCVLDLDRAEYPSGKELLEAAVSELNSGFPDESMAAVRKGGRYVRKLQKLDESIQQQEVEFIDGETYLVTGGTGPVAGEICRVLAGQAKLNLILTGRKPLPEGEKAVSSDADPSIADKLEVLKSIEQAGSKAVYYPVDVNDPEQMKELIQTVNREWGPVNGVVHAAGLWDASSFQLLSKELDIIKKVLQPKVQGTIITDLVTRDQPLKFFAALSSVSASRKLWSAGLGDYAAANAFLDGYAYYRNSVGAPGKTVALNYSLWAEKGMVQKFGDATLLAVKAQGLNPLKAETAAAAFIPALQFKQESVIHILDLIPATGKSPNLPVIEKMATDKSFSRGDSVLPVKNVRGQVLNLIAGYLDIPEGQLDISANFMEIGLDSIGATRMISDISRLLNMELYPTLVFEYQTPEELIRYIENTLKQAGESGSPAETKSGQAGEAAHGAEDDDIAIIGMSLRVPGANTLTEYWDIIKEGKCVIGDIPAERWDAEEFYSTDSGSAHTMYSKKGGFIRNPYDFDPLFFGISPNEAEVMDPQQRIFLMVAWEALQSAGYGGKHCTNRIGVFAGTEQNTYMEHFAGYNSYMRIKRKLGENEAFKSLEKDKQEKILSGILNTLEPAKMVADAVAGNGLNEIAARVSHCLNLTGPSLIVNSACSSSLVAVHLACENLRSGQADMAIAGGVNLNLNPTPFICLSRVTALSPTGACYPFDSRADGLVLSEGTGAVLLKPLKNAVQDKDFIYAVIKGSAINNDGRSQGITAPRPQGQAETIRNAYLKAGINPETVSYIETHGTGTPLGDPIEVEGMTLAMRTFTDKKTFCGIGSAKAAIGHMLSAAGIVSLIKVVLALNNRMLPQTVNFDRPNPNINFESSPFYVISKAPKKWESTGDFPRRAGVNAFGFGGTNAHVILEEAPETEAEQEAGEKTPYILTLTGRNEKVIKIIAAKLKDYVIQSGVDTGSVCYTMNNAQKEMSFKLAATISNKEELLETLEAIENGNLQGNIFKGRSNPNREMPVYLVMQDEEPLSEGLVDTIGKRYRIFGEAYGRCMDICTECADTRDGIVHDRVRLFSFHYAAGVLLHDFDVVPSGIFTGGTGIAAAMALTGIVSLKQAAAMVCEINPVAEEPEGITAALFGNCEVITEQGPVSNENLVWYVQNREIYNFKVNAGWINSSAGKDDALIFIKSNCEDLKQYNSKAFGMFSKDLSEPLSEEPVHRLLAGLYTCGARFNPGRLYGKNTRRIPLPTYPFEYQTYKVSFKDDSLVNTAEAETVVRPVPVQTAVRHESKPVPSVLQLVKMEKLPVMDPEERKRSLEMLKADLLRIP
ncbi:type I polyketide synthase [Ruminiclostridium cellobioparum]|uniref:type I polyketide synthase n=1 Tax=Ruminiclostridium cellobioparum TaxID=29355 RepID=UPI0028ADF9CE|nr:type I polyketide synthase [Ruminiclostridium cellobioparum]